ncbi:BnaAnng24070D [Brassica napus]|uniref:BnaAnng24070D protein n=1 Tax=Brassica napus TaxID=3708 RepID=A0A078JLP6_BRANA|nr:BnaAnng24070D [Brassica napus]
MSYLPPVWTLANYANTFPDTRDYRMTVDMLICALDHPM